MTTDSVPTRATPPGPVVGSFWILIASAALRVFAAVLTWASWNSIIDTALKSVPKGMSAAQWRSEIHTLLIANIVLDLVFAGLYVLFAYKIREGRNWARLTITGIVVVFGLYDILTGATAFTLVSVIIELVAVSLLYLASSKEFFAAAKRLP